MSGRSGSGGGLRSEGGWRVGVGGGGIGAGGGPPLKPRGADADLGHMFDVKSALHELVEKGGSDLHLKVNSSPLHRVNGELMLDTRVEPLGPADTESALTALLTDEVKLEEFAQDHEVDFSFEIEDVARFRINAFRQRGAISMVCRAIPHRISTIDELSLPPVVRELAEEERGIVLLTGTTGSGKSTTLAAMIDHMN